jgi:hypothetical protein
MKTTYHLEARLSNHPDKWSKCTFSECQSLEKVKNDFQKILARQKENAEINYKISGIRVLEYRIVQVNTSTTESVVLNHLCKSPEYDKRKSDELHYFKQAYKYLKHLQHIYRNHPVEDVKRAWSVNASLMDAEIFIEKLEKEVTTNCSEEWRTFDQS